MDGSAFLASLAAKTTSATATSTSKNVQRIDFNAGEIRTLPVSLAAKDVSSTQTCPN